MNLTVAAVALAVSASMGAWAGHHFTALHYDSVIAENKAEADEALAAANGRADKAASDYEAWKVKQRPKTVTITREVQSAVQADADCSARALPVQLRDALTRAADPDQSGADRAMPGASAAGAFDLGRPRAGLRRGAD